MPVPPVPLSTPPNADEVDLYFRQARYTLNGQIDSYSQITTEQLERGEYEAIERTHRFITGDSGATPLENGRNGWRIASSLTKPGTASQDSDFVPGRSLQGFVVVLGRTVELQQDGNVWVSANVIFRTPKNAETGMLYQAGTRRIGSEIRIGYQLEGQEPVYLLVTRGFSFEEREGETGEDTVSPTSFEDPMLSRAPDIALTVNEQMYRYFQVSKLVTGVPAGRHSFFVAVDPKNEKTIATEGSILSEVTYT